MKVRATSLGYYGDMRRREGEVFVLVPYKDRRKTIKNPNGKEITVTAEEQFSENWMEKVDQKAAVRRPTKTATPRSELFPPKPAGNARAAHEPRPEAVDEQSDGSDTVI